MVSDTKSHLGKFDWFRNYLELTPPDSGLGKMASDDGVSPFGAIQTIVISSLKQNWITYLSASYQAANGHKTISRSIVEELTNVFLNNHSLVPHIGRSIQSEHPITCLEGEHGGMTNKLAYWENGLLYSYELVNDNKNMYAFAIAPATHSAFAYPEVDEIIRDYPLTEETIKES